jgi:hypothetical protein
MWFTSLSNILLRQNGSAMEVYQNIFAPLLNISFLICYLVCWFFPLFFIARLHSFNSSRPSRRINSVSELNYHKFSNLLAKRFYVRSPGFSGWNTFYTLAGGKTWWTRCISRRVGNANSCDCTCLSIRCLKSAESSRDRRQEGRLINASREVNKFHSERQQLHYTLFRIQVSFMEIVLFRRFVWKNTESFWKLKMPHMTLWRLVFYHRSLFFCIHSKEFVCGHCLLSAARCYSLLFSNFRLAVARTQ